MNDSRNIILIGMPGAGKSTIGVLLAKALGMDFIDTDIIIQQRTGRLLQDIIDNDGIDAFLAVEETVLCSLELTNSVIATGGSAVYSDKAMTALKRGGKAVYISLPYEEVEKRITNITTRGIVLRSGNTLRDAYNERVPLYEKYSDITIDCSGRDIESSMRELVAKL
ncbi:MAG: shikimate kinase [Clostridiales bacterium]|nr:shikimate kinase [Clostridiales bacterium]